MRWSIGGLLGGGGALDAPSSDVGLRTLSPRTGVGDGPVRPGGGAGSDAAVAKNASIQLTLWRRSRPGCEVDAGADDELAESWVRGALLTLLDDANPPWEYARTFSGSAYPPSLSTQVRHSPSVQSW